MNMSSPTEIKGLLRLKQYIDHIPLLLVPHQVVTEGDYDIPENLGATFFVTLLFLSQTQEMCTAPSVQGAHLEQHPLEVICTDMLPLAIISLPVLPNPWAIDQ